MSDGPLYLLQLLAVMYLTWKNLWFLHMKKSFPQQMDSLIHVFWDMELMVLCFMGYFMSRFGVLYFYLHHWYIFFFPLRVVLIPMWLFWYGLSSLQEVAIKRMTVTKTKEFLAEVKVLCRVHHSNLVIHILALELVALCVSDLWLLFWFTCVKVELIGYAATDDELFLIYEYAQKGSLKSHLHDPQNKGKLLADALLRMSQDFFFLVSYFQSYSVPR